MKLKYKIEEHYSEAKKETRFYIFGYDRYGNKYDSMWSSADKSRAVDLLKRVQNKGGK